MKNLVFVFWILIGLVSCKNKPSQLQIIDNKVVGSIFQPSNYYSKFKYNNLKEFRIDSLSSSAKTLIKLDSLDWKTIFQDSSSFDFDSYYFYSNFSDSTQITIFEEDEESSSDIIWLLRYDRKGKLIGKNLLAIEGNDDGGWWKSYGRFIGEQYLKTELYEESDKRERDSSTKKVIFLPNGLEQFETQCLQ